jgi:hypothetical protein
VAAGYSHQVDYIGPNDVSFQAFGVPTGLTIDSEGRITGVPEDEGSFDGASVTVISERGDRARADCPAFTIAPALNHDLLTRPPTAPRGCLPLSENLEDHLQGGDGSLITCAIGTGTDDNCLVGNGNGVLPEGVSFDPSTCRAAGEPPADVHGSWVWMVDVSQSGRTIQVPFCATNELDPPFHDIDVVMDGQDHDPLSPFIFAYDAAGEIRFGAQMGDPRFDVTRQGCPPGACDNWGYKFLGSCSPLNNDDQLPDGFSFLPEGSLDDQDGVGIGFFHEMFATSQGKTATQEGFGERPWVINWQIWYCTADNPDDCEGGANSTAIFENAQTRFTTSIIGYPQAP